MIKLLSELKYIEKQSSYDKFNLAILVQNHHVCLHHYNSSIYSIETRDAQWGINRTFGDRGMVIKIVDTDFVAKLPFVLPDFQ